MDSKTKHRILGILVIAGLVIITLPFLQSGKELSAEETVVKKPPFPDQPIQVTTVTPLETVKQQPDDTIKNEPATTTTTTASNPVAPVITTPVLTAPAPTPEASAEPIVPPTQEPIKNSIKSSNKLQVKSATKPIVRTAQRTIKRINLHAPIDNNGLFKLQSAAWVIQVGSFKNKANALRIVNSLRANGYSAFIQQIAENTRVFVGPETQQVSARKLAQQIEADMKLRGIVISYKPLAL